MDTKKDDPLGHLFLGIMFNFDRIKRLHPGVQNAKKGYQFR